MKVNTELVEHLYQMYQRLSNIRRYNTQFCSHPENVAAHSFHVAYITMLLADVINQARHVSFTLEPLDTEKAMRMALLHDVEESVSGDILHTMKMEDETFRVALEDINCRIMDRMFNFSGSGQKYVDLWKAKDDPGDQEGRLVLIADTLSLLCYTTSEMSMGNNNVEEAYVNGHNRLSKILQEDADVFGPISDLPKLFRQSSLRKGLKR